MKQNKRFQSSFLILSSVKELKRFGGLLVFLMAGFLNFLAAQTENTLLWKISGNGLDKPSYLYGTMHVADQRAYQLGDSVWEAIHACEGLALELLISEINPFSLVGMTLMPKDSSLHDFLTEEEYQVVKKAVETYAEKETAGLIDQVKPFFTMGAISGALLPSDKPQALDEWLEKYAKKLNKKTFSIETVEEQMGAITTVPLKTQARDLYEICIGIDSLKIAMEIMMTAYQNQDMVSIQRITEEEGMSETMNDGLIRDRNYRMAERIDTLIRKRTVFSAIGTAHLPGKEGVISLLRKIGYQVDPVFSEYNPHRFPEIVYEDWLPYLDKKRKFQVDFPGPVVVKEKEEKVGKEKIKSLFLHFEDEQEGHPIVLSLMIATVPKQRRELTQSEFYQEFASDHNNLIYQKQTEVAGIPALELGIKMNDGIVSRLFIVLNPRKKQCCILSIASDAEVIAQQAFGERFRQSLKFD